MGDFKKVKVVPVDFVPNQEGGSRNFPKSGVSFTGMRTAQTSTSTPGPEYMPMEMGINDDEPGKKGWRQKRQDKNEFKYFIYRAFADIKGFNRHGQIKGADGRFMPNTKLEHFMDKAFTLARDSYGEDQFIRLLYEARVPTVMITNEQYKSRLDALYHQKQSIPPIVLKKKPMVNTEDDNQEPHRTVKVKHRVDNELKTQTENFGPPSYNVKVSESDINKHNTLPGAIGYKRSYDDGEENGNSDTHRIKSKKLNLQEDDFWLTQDE